jgi:uncharacterized protein
MANVERQIHRFCWADLATVDDVRAAKFYAALFGWTTRRHVLDEGAFQTLAHGGVDFASVYRLAQEQVAQAAPSHWLPYVSTPSIEATLSDTLALGGSVLVEPQTFCGWARVSVIVDPTGAPLGLWQDDAGEPDR